MTTGWLVDAITSRSKGSAEPRDPERTISIGIGRMAREFIKSGAPVGAQRLTAVAVARNLWGAGYDVEAAAEALWAGLQQNNDPARDPWTWDEALAIARDVYASEPAPLKPLARADIVRDTGIAHAPVLIARDGAKEQPARTFRALDVDEWLADDEDDDFEIVIGDGGDGAILTLDGKGAIAGGPGIGKSNMVLRLGRCLAEGAPFLNMPIPMPRRVLDLATEGSRRGYKRRIEKVWEGASPEARARWRMTLAPMHLRDDLDAIEALIAEHKPEVLIVDSLRNAHSANENDSQQMTDEVTRILDGIAARHRCAVVLVHHSRKADPKTRIDDPISSIRGTTAFTAWLSFALVLTPKARTPDTLVATWAKVRDAEERLPDLEVEFVRSTIDFKASARSEETSVEDLILTAVFHAGELKKAEIIERVKPQTGAGARRIAEAVVALKRAGKLASFIAPADQRSRAETYYLPETQTGFEEDQ
jgi:hypothetical protein